ncbi:MAG: 6-bladed beta-propeller [Bacteroidales bacterium]|nr:6-bladed beta-propeller [Bacteroidales bacterium]
MAGSAEGKKVFMISFIKKIVLFPVLYGLGCFIACSSNKHYDNNKIELEISYSNKITQIKLSDLNIFDIEYIPLETNEKSMFPGISIEDDVLDDKVLVTDNAIYINSLFGSSILKFNLEGKYLTQIGKKGHGPEEYLFLNDFSIDFKHNRIAILSLVQDKIFLYTTDGEFLKTISCPIDITHIFCNEGAVLCYKRNTGTNTYAFDLLDYDGKIVKSYLNKHQYTPGTMIFVQEDEECLHYYKNDTLYIKERYCDTIFKFADLQFEPYMVLNRGDKRYTTELLVFSSDDEMLKVRNLADKNYITELELIELDKYIYTYIIEDDSFKTFVASKNITNGVSSSSYDLLKNDIDGGPDLFLLTSRDAKTLVSFINPHELKAYILTEHFINSKPVCPDKKEQLVRFANSVNEDDNPIIVLLKVR